MFCSDCGRRLPTEELLPFCPYCGKRLMEEGEPIPKPAEPKPKKTVKKPFKIAAAALAALVFAGLLFGTLFFAKLWRDAKADPENRKATSVQISPAEGTGTIYPGETVSLGIKAYPENACFTDPEWRSSDPKTAAVDNNGNVLFKREGTVTVYARLENGVEGSIELTASKKPYRLSLGAGSMELAIMSSYTFVPVVSPEDAEYDLIVWESSDRSILRVDQDGTVTGVGQGVATVTATVAGTVIGQADVFVYKYRFDLLTNHIMRHGQRYVHQDGRTEYYITLDYKEEMKDGVRVSRNTFVSYFPDADRAVLYCYIADSDTSFAYQTVVLLDKSNKTSLGFEVYCYAKNGSSLSRDVPLTSVGALNITGYGKIDVPRYKPGDELDFTKYEGDDTFRESALEIAKSLVGDSLKALWDSWESFSLGYSMTELTGFEFD